MTLGETLISVSQQVHVEEKTTVGLDGRTYSVGSTRALLREWGCDPRPDVTRPEATP